MSAGTKIQWADDTHNFWRGCTKVSPGCANCYAERLVTTRLGGEWGKGRPRVRIKDFDAPLRWNKDPWSCDGCGEPCAERFGACMNPGCLGKGRHRRRVFSLSLGDFWDEEAPPAWRAEALEIVRRCENLDFLLLTKRPENITEKLPANVWLGTSVENQDCADKRIPILANIPAKTRFLSIEPLLGRVDLGFPSRWAIDWVIVGGESGPGARPCDINWIRSIVIQCKLAGVPCFVKQLGKWPRLRSFRIYLADKKGGNIEEWPDDLKVREWPEKVAA